MSKPAPWLDSTPALDVRTLATDELVEVWTGNRNNLLGAMAADEMMKRLKIDRRIILKETS